MNLEYWIELPKNKKRLVLLFILQLRTFDFDEIYPCCPERVWLNEAGIDANKIPNYVFKMSVADIKGELTFCGGDPVWT